MVALLEAFRMVAAPDVLVAILASSVYGLVVGSLPGLSATMATALLVPVTFYLSPLAAVASIVAASAMAIFSGDIPGCLLRIPGTPASAAYTDEAYAMTRKGQAELALGAGLWFSAIGGIAGTVSLVLLAPALAELALQFSSFEYFWLGLMGLMCATLVARGSPVKALASMCVGLLIACVGTRLRPHWNAPGSATAATMALARTGPTPGISISRRPTSVDRALALIWRSVSSACALTSCSWVTSSRRQARAKGGTRSSLPSTIISINRWSPSRPIGATMPYSAMWPRIAFASRVRWRISSRRVRCNTITLCCSAVFTATKRLVGRPTASQIASASAASFFWRLT
jgi:Tripartite tricarboxylate transporter TctA family